ncbi:MAG: Sec-independent protein translocase subunit TatA [Marmoricola sp.]
MFRQIGAPEIILILAVVILLFGAKKLPDLARGSGRALRIFKAETKGLIDDDEDETAAAATPLEVRAPEAAAPQVQAEAETQAKTTD